MTKLYVSTSYSRKEKYIGILSGINTIPDHPPFYSNHCLELVSFIDRASTRFLNKQKGIVLIDSFLKALSFDKPIILNNRNFKLTLSPKIETHKQISCPAFTSNIRRPAQLTIKCATNKLNSDKLKNMFLANLAHFMDSDIMHNFVELVNNINVDLVEEEIVYTLIYERNHDCFILHPAFLIDILVEESYLRFMEYDSMQNFDEDIRKQFVDLTYVINSVN